jgi:hypothetical protein
MIERSNNISTVTTTTPHNLMAGRTVMIDGATGIEDTNGVYTGAGRWNIFGQVLDTPTPYTFTIADPGENGIGSGGTILLVEAPRYTAVVPGPFVLNPNEGVVITSVSTYSMEPIAALRGIKELRVASITDFADTGYVVFGFGTQYEVGPVRYVGAIGRVVGGATQYFLLIDRTFVFPKDIPTGFDVTMLYQNTPWNPANDGSIGAFFTTGSSSGRAAAQTFLDEAAAAGINVNNYIIYPGDRGMAGEGLGITGQRISDKVQVWASDNVDQEVSEAHNE